MNIVLASASPRRASLLQELGLSFKTIAPNVDERIDDNEAPKDYVKRVANAKALAVSEQYCNDIVIAADTVAVFNHQVLGKAKSRDEAKRMLERINGQTHQVLTALSMHYQAQQYHHISQTMVSMADYDEDLLQAYLDCGDWSGKAGACSLQGRGGLLIKSIAGDLQATVGLSFTALYEGFKTFSLEKEFLLNFAQPVAIKEKDDVR